MLSECWDTRDFEKCAWFLFYDCFATAGKLQPVQRQRGEESGIDMVHCCTLDWGLSLTQDRFPFELPSAYAPKGTKGMTRRVGLFSRCCTTSPCVPRCSCLTGSENEVIIVSMVRSNLQYVCHVPVVAPTGPPEGAHDI